MSQRIILITLSLLFVTIIGAQTIAINASVPGAHQLKFMHRG